MKNKYFIAVKKINLKNKEVTAYYGEDSISYVYFEENIESSFVKHFTSLEEAKEYLAEVYSIIDGKLKFKGYYEDNLIGFPKIVKLTMSIEDVYELT
jgi:hypothetical protein